jgi:hypothetical protein
MSSVSSADCNFLQIKNKKRKDPHKNFTKEVKMLKWARNRNLLALTTVTAQ